MTLKKIKNNLERRALALLKDLEQIDGKYFRLSVIIQVVNHIIPQDQIELAKKNLQKDINYLINEGYLRRDPNNPDIIHFNKQY